MRLAEFTFETAMKLKPSSANLRKAHQGGAVVCPMDQDLSFAPAPVQSMCSLKLGTESKERRPPG